ncbi:PCYCGC motif-containing (lipo)protein [Rummeliibacillus pycnus]|uniref:PCYCGC motif-containing (lipo)protein n=1 Tax=Rummeliibacillus pycnus TaxID=101070 RepID=UPI003D29B34F
MKKKWLSVLLAGTMILAACGNNAEESSKKNHTEHDQTQTKEQSNHGSHQHTLANGDLQEETASANKLPSFLDNQSEDLKLVYTAAGQATEVLKWMPCYCGCAESANHKSNLNCFIKKVKDDGSVVWDDHGTRCIVCVEIAVKSIKQAQEGASLKEIRKQIDNDYKEGYAKPTSTPMPL